MPTPHKRVDNQRKHLTRAEREERRTAEDGLRRKTRVVLRAPGWLSAEARKVWRDVRRKTRGLDLLDNVDAEQMAIYCDAVANYAEASAMLRTTSNPDAIRGAQAWARLAMQLAEKLGLTPAARARLARKAAQEAPADALEQLLGEAMEIVGGDVRP